MSSAVWNIGQDHRINAERIRDFIFKTEKQKIPVFHTVDEYHEFLKELMDDCYGSYDEIAKDHGWK